MKGIRKAIKRLALYRAIEKKECAEVIRGLVDTKTLTFKNKKFGTPLNRAIKLNSDPDVIKLLITPKALRILFKKYSPLASAILNCKNPEVIKLLLREDSDIFGYPPLFFAIKKKV